MVCCLPSDDGCWNLLDAVDPDTAICTVCVELLPPPEASPRIPKAVSTELKHEDLVPLPSVPPRMPTSIESQSSLKTQPCRFFMSRKGCTKGASCTYAHGDMEMRSGMATEFRYKTKLCAVYAKACTCPLGSSCTFAHGTDELFKASKRSKLR